MMLLCEAAQVADQKLYIMGGGISVIGPDPVPSAIAIKIDVDLHETDASHYLVLYLEDADGRPVMIDTPEGQNPVEVSGEFPVARPTTLPAGAPADVSMVIGLPPLPLAPGNRYIWRLSIDGNTEDNWTLPFTVRPRPEG
jgi:hypothetical protein